MKKYLIGLVIISGLMFFLISNDSDSNESNSYKNALRPNPIQLAEFALGDDDPILMVNLLKFKDKAEYEDGRATNLTGREAYEIYFCLLYTSPSPRDVEESRMPSSA